PAIYWAAMIKVPDRSMFPGTGPNGNGINPLFKTQDQYLNFVKTNGCGNCHQIGNYATRTIPDALGNFDSSIAAWARRLQSGPAGTTLIQNVAQPMSPDRRQLPGVAVWSDRLHAGQSPGSTPARP